MKNIHLNLAKCFRNILQDFLSGGKLNSCEKYINRVLVEADIEYSQKESQEMDDSAN